MVNSKTLEVALYSIGFLIILWSLTDIVMHYMDPGIIHTAVVCRAIFGCCIIFIGRSIAINRTLKKQIVI